MDSLLIPVVTLFCVVICLGAVAYFPLQVLATVRLRRGLRVASMLPIPFMLATTIWTVVAYCLKSDLWPIPLLFSAVPATFYLLVLLLAHRLTPPIHRSVRSGYCPTCEYDCRGIGAFRCPECGGPLRVRSRTDPPGAT